MATPRSPSSAGTWRRPTIGGPKPVRSVTPPTVRRSDVVDKAWLQQALADGAAPESNRPSRGLHDRTSFEDPLGHRAHAAPPGTLAAFLRRWPRYARAHE